MEFKRFKSENSVWDYFKRSTNGERAKCDTYGTYISCKGDQQELWETTCIWNTRFRLRQRQKRMFFFGSQFYR